MSIGDALIAIVAGLLAGAYAGVLGVGGGIVMVPAMVLFLGQSQHVAEGTSLLAIIATALAAVRVHRRGGLVSARWAQLLGAGGVLGAALGSGLAVWVVHDERMLRKIFGVFLLVVAAWVLVRRMLPAAEPERDPGAPLVP